MNMHSHYLRGNNRSLELPETHRAFGKDITNVSKGLCPGNLTKKIISEYHQSEKTTMEEENVERKDPILDYHNEIIRFMQSFSKKEEIMQEEGTDVNDKMRQILIDWMVDVHQSFELKEETLFLAIIYLDQYQNKMPIKKDEYQLVGIACLWIASKYEEIYPPRMKNYVDVTASTYTAAQLKQMEGKIILFLDFNLTKITPLTLLQVIQINQGTHDKNMSMGKYILHLCYLNGRIIKRYETKTLIFAAMKLSDAICKKQTNLSLLEHPSQAQIYSCYKQMCLLLQLQNKYKLTAVKRKFQKQKFHCVGKIRLQA